MVPLFVGRIVACLSDGTAFTVGNQISRYDKAVWQHSGMLHGLKRQMSKGNAMQTSRLFGALANV